LSSDAGGAKADQGAQPLRLGQQLIAGCPRSVPDNNEIRDFGRILQRIPPAAQTGFTKGRHSSRMMANHVFAGEQHISVPGKLFVAGAE